MPDENVFEFTVDMPLQEAMTVCLSIARSNKQWQIEDESITEDSFSFHVSPEVNALNTSLRKSYQYHISLFPSGTEQTRIQFNSQFHDRLSGSAILEYMYLRSRLILLSESLSGEQDQLSRVVADLHISAPLYKTAIATGESLDAAGAQNLDVRRSRSHYELFEFDLPSFPEFATALVRGLDKHSRVTIEVPSSHARDEGVRQFIDKFQRELDNRVDIESSYAISSDDADEPEYETDPVIDGTHIFISYRRDDTADVSGRIYDRLERHYDREMLFKDVDTIPLGADFRKVIDDAVSQCRVVLAVIGRDWISVSNAQGIRRLDDPADFVRLELEYALARGVPVIPVLVRGADMPPETDLPDSLKALVYRQAIQVRSDPDFHTDMDRLVRGIEYLFGRSS